MLSDAIHTHVFDLCVLKQKTVEKDNAREGVASPVNLQGQGIP